MDYESENHFFIPDEYTSNVTTNNTISYLPFRTVHGHDCSSLDQLLANRSYTSILRFLGKILLKKINAFWVRYEIAAHFVWYTVWHTVTDSGREK